MPDLWTPGGNHHVAVSRQDQLSALASASLARGREGLADDSPERRQMAIQRRLAQRVEAAGRGSPEVMFATGRPKDPFFYWQQNNLPYDTNKPDELKSVRKWCRLLYMTHPILASAIDIYSKYPLTGVELVCKDNALTDFYSTLFFDRLKYKDYLVKVLREYWIAGEAWPLGQFNEILGVWEDDELLNPDDIEVHKSPFFKEPRFLMRLPETLRKVIADRDPPWEYAAIARSYPELLRFANSDKPEMPVSNILLKQLRFDADTFNPRGIPIMMRGFRAIFQEEMLNAAQDAVASRLYTPLVLAKLGASAQDLGTTEPWIPTTDDLSNFEEALDIALAADFRVLVHHFAIEMETVFGRETMPQMDADFERLTERQLQVFGLSKTMLSGSSGSGQVYAADALNRDLISQLLTTAQELIRQFFTDRMMVVAEAQEHYDYEERGGKRYPIMEEVLEVDEETGEQRIVEQPKLLVPDIRIKTMNMKDEAVERQFIEALRAEGIPISMKTRLVNVPIDLDEEMERTQDEQVQMAVKAQETRRETYLALRSARLPIPEDLRNDFEPKASDASEHSAADADHQVPPLLGVQDPAPTDALAPSPEEMMPERMVGGDKELGEEARVLELPRNRMMDPGRTRPIESDEMRSRMPKPASREEIESGDAKGLLEAGPRHIGMRRYAGVSADTPLDGDEESAETG